MDNTDRDPILNTDLFDPESDRQESYRIPTRRTESYTPYVPNQSISLEDEDTEPLISGKEDPVNNTKFCLRSAYTPEEEHGKNSVFRYLPVLFVLFIFSTIYGLFFVYHLKPEINQDLSHYGTISDKVFAEIAITHVLLVLFLLSYILCMMVSPGTIPNTSEWSLTNGQNVDNTSLVFETKKSGARRVCKWCSKYKPDRTHHCRVCGICVLKMDHHCPWVNNCIGWNNHKYFFLSVFYSSVLSTYIAILYYPTVRHILNNQIMPFGELMLIVLSEVLSVIFAIVCTCFLLFHTWLMCEALTTIEVCEKRSYSNMLLERSIWSNGLYDNIKCVLGKNPLLWLIPIDDREGDGIAFVRTERCGDKEFYDDNDHTYDENSVFVKLARETRQFNPIVIDETLQDA
ncbi:zinc finger protein DHHC domain containing protein [Theileria equi strain WA]|uniref:Palmitoyltransferase n=1 Tax=Theileria equi strain WA TaxID=1537102 RepID=L0AVR6_THEEQ|nr:zinc finger protein DHHC domain containing protein [Theileria equi strain WA]AFZ79333.1 zinc finger protein DHHC domain containing protein [Theileria equi strain WA]|eukprot:XP_004828999.1 zinc finger protein DHHC domain containing protein [Theileria equi strain WA]